MTHVMTGGDHPVDEVAAYALGALEESEVRDLAAHLEECAECTAELERLSQGVAALPLSVPPLAAPATLRRAVLAEIGGRAAPRARGRISLPWLTTPRVLAPVAAGLAVAAVVVAVALSGGSSPNRVVSAHVSIPAAAARLQVSGSRGELIVEHMPQPPAGKIYEVWLSRRGGPPIPTDALFDVRRSGATEVALPASLSGVTAVLVTAEPLGGSIHPTSAPVIVADL